MQKNQFVNEMKLKNGPYEGRTHDLRVISTAL